MAREGVEHSIIIPVASPQYRSAMQILDLVSEVDVFQDFPMDRATEVLQIAATKKYKAGAVRLTSLDR